MEEIDLKDLILLFWEKRNLIITIVLIFIILGFVYTMFLVTPKYTSTTKLVLVSGNETANTITSSDLSINSNLVSTYREIVTSDSVLDKVIQNLNLVDVTIDELKKAITVSEVEDAEVLQIAVENIDSRAAQTITNEIADVFIQRAAELYNINNIRVLDEAKEEEQPSNVNHLKDLVIFTAIGIIVSVGYILVINMLDNSVKSADEIERNLKVPVLATIPIKQNSKKRGGGR